MSKTNQPNWKFVENLGDASPIEHGGAFLYVDTTGVYPPEVEMLFAPYEDPEDESKEAWEVRRFIIEPCTYVDGILSDNKYRPGHSAWFAKSYNPDRTQDGPGGLESMSSSLGVSKKELVEMFLGNLYERAQAWINVGQHYGFDNFDEYPLRFTKEAVEERYSEEIEELTRRCRSGDNVTFSKCWAHHPRGGYIEGWASEVGSGLYSPERYIADTVEDAVIGGSGFSVPASQVHPGDAPEQEEAE